MDTADELEAIVGQISPEPVSPSTPRALSPIPQEPSSFAPRPPAVRAARPVTDVAPTRTSAPHHKYGKLPEHLKSLVSWWGCLSPKMRESVELRAAGDDNDAIARKMGKTAKSVSVMINVARRRLEARRDASVEQPPGDQEEKPEEGGEGEGDDDEPEPDGGPGEGVDVDVDIGPEPARDFNLQGTPNEKGSFVEEAGGSNLVAYLRSIRTYRVLTREEELELTTRFEQTRDPRLARRLVQANLRFVVRAALSYSRERGKLIDLIQEGNLGLMRGVEKFDPSKGMRLLTYAQHWIHAYIKIFIIKDKRLIRIGKTHSDRALFWSLSKTRNRLREENGGVEPTSEENRPGDEGQALGRRDDEHAPRPRDRPAEARGRPRRRRRRRPGVAARRQGAAGRGRREERGPAEDPSAPVRHTPHVEPEDAAHPRRSDLGRGAPDAQGARPVVRRVARAHPSARGAAEGQDPKEVQLDAEERRLMVTYYRAFFWALSFGMFLHIGLDERHGVFQSLAGAVFWTAVCDRLVSSSISKHP